MSKNGFGFSETFWEKLVKTEQHLIPIPDSFLLVLLTFLLLFYNIQSVA